MVLATVAVSGCSGLAAIDTNVKQARGAIESNQTKLRDEAGSGAVVRTTRPRLAGEEIQLIKKDVLPPKFSESVIYVSTGDSLATVLDTIAQQHNIQIRLLQQPTDSAKKAVGPQTMGRQDDSFQVEWRSGTLKGLLDHIAQRLKMYWRFRDNRVEFFETETRSYHVYLPNGAKTVSSSISLGNAGGSTGSGGGTGTTGSSTSGGGGSGSGTVSVSSSVSMDPFTSIAKTVNAMLMEDGLPRTAGGSTAAPTAVGAAAGAGAMANPSAGAGMTPGGRTQTSGSVVVNGELGMITVTARPPTLERVGAYIDAINRRFGQNVLVDVKIYSVTSQRDLGAGLSLDLVYNTLSKYGISVTGPSPLQPANGTPGVMTVDFTGSRTQSSLMVQALSQFGDVSLVRSGQVITVNGQPAPMQLADEITYLASSATTTAANVGQTATLTPGSKTVGFTANFLPMILGDNRIQLQYQVTLSSLLSMNQVSSNGAMIQTPAISTQSLQQQAYVRDGQAIVLFGFEQDRNATDGAASIGGFSRTAGQQRSMLVIVMQVFGGGNRESV